MEPPAGEEQLCVLLLEHGAGQHVARSDAGCQWEGPDPDLKEDRKEDRREVGCQSDLAETRDAGVQVDLLSQQLSWRHSGPSTMLLRCRPDGEDGGALLQHCSTNRTRTRIIRPAIKFSDAPAESKASVRRRAPPQSFSTTRQSLSQRRSRQKSPDQQEEEEEEEEEVEEEMMTVEEDTGDPTWDPAEGDMESRLLPSALGDAQLDSDSQHAPLCDVKLELEPDNSVCDVCGKVMKNKSSLARHSFIHTGKKPFACHLCELRFNRRDNLQHHLTRLHPNGVAKLEKQRQVQAWLCAVCGKTFSCRSRLKTHEVIHSGVKPHRCDLCPKAYMRTNDLEHHKKMVHVDGAGAAELQRPSSLLCDFCGKEFKCKSQLAIHFQTHTGERPHLCDICGRKFGRQYQLKRHKILVHANHMDGEENLPPDAAFVCVVCGKRLKSEALLHAHARMHTGDKPYRCSICLRSFQRAACLKQHHARVHLKMKAGDASHAASRRRGSHAANTFPCSVCSKVFKFRSLLASHSLIHSELRPFACDFCSRSFRRLSHLKRHREVVHANGARLPQSFVCHICGKDKKCRSQLARHVIIHTGERPFVCDLCPARFNRHGNLQQHKKRMHGVGKPADEEDVPVLFGDEDEDYDDEDDDMAETADALESAEEQFDAAPDDMEVAAQLETT
ncbi:zinc finger protein ZFP2-like [Cololabis saira]|uniref:zinc finger protein ZFP2-like n=1 Tax=Cololabis saira TaxID=129043 RepID=UPI002AD2DCD3|nr:zinc finger protein ZFP2-like [Cololabis saira]XP_061569069.1 zinc finger protein ZFP2-like [Cololabis saira]